MEDRGNDVEHCFLSFKKSFKISRSQICKSKDRQHNGQQKKGRQHNDQQKKDKQHNGQQKKDRQHNGQQKKDRQRYTKHYTETEDQATSTPQKPICL